MMKIFFRSILILSILLIASACSEKRSSRKEDAFLQLISVEEMNTKIRFWKPRPTEVFKRGDSITLDLENVSKERIIFPSDYGIRILYYQEATGNWTEIDNSMTYIPPGNRQVSPKGPELPGVIDVGLSPKLPKDGPPLEIRVVVIGVVETSNEQVGAYIDFTLQP